MGTACGPPRGGAASEGRAGVGRGPAFTCFWLQGWARAAIAEQAPQDSMARGAKGGLAPGFKGQG